MFDDVTWKPKPTKSLYRKQYALVIGIDKYTHYATLHYPVEDAREIGALIKTNFGFDLVRGKVLENASYEQIIAAFEYLISETEKGDAVFIFFSGHGIRQDNTGFLVPADGAPNTKNWIAVDNVVAYLKRVPALHIFMACDMCYAGTFLQNYFVTKEKTSAKTIQFLLSGSETQTVPDSSIFAYHLLQAFSGFAGGTRLRFVRASEVIQYVEHEIRQGQSAQHVMGDYVMRDTLTSGELQFAWQTQFIPPKILRDLNNDSAALRQAAIRRLSTEFAKDEFIVPAFAKLSEIIYEDPDTEVRRTAIESLGNLGHEDTIPFLLAFLNNYYPTVYSEDTQDPFLFSIMGVFEELRDKRVIVPILKYLRNDDLGEVSKIIILSTLDELMELVDAHSNNDILSELFYDIENDPSYQERSIEYLSRIGGTTAEEYLFRLIANNNLAPNIRLRSLISLGASGNEAIIKKLAAWIKKEDDQLLIHHGRRIITYLKKRFGFHDWDEEELLFREGIVVPDYPVPRYLDNVLNLTGCDRLTALIELIQDTCNIPIGDRQLAAICLLTDETSNCNTLSLKAAYSSLCATVTVEKNLKQIDWINRAIELIEDELKNR